MPTLYVARGACSFAAHLLVHELQLPITVQVVPLRTPDSPIHAINPLGRVPAVQFEDGSLLTENSAILPWLAEQRPDSTLFAPPGTLERAQIQSWLGYLNSELHVGAFRPLNRPERYSADDSHHAAIRAQALQQLHATLRPIDEALRGRDYLVGARFTLADAYLGVFLHWLGRLPSEAFADLAQLARVREAWLARPSVQAALAAEAAH